MITSTNVLPLAMIITLTNDISPAMITSTNVLPPATITSTSVVPPAIADNCYSVNAFTYSKHIASPSFFALQHSIASYMYKLFISYSSTCTSKCCSFHKNRSRRCNFAPKDLLLLMTHSGLSRRGGRCSNSITGQAVFIRQSYFLFHCDQPID